MVWKMIRSLGTPRNQDDKPTKGKYTPVTSIPLSKNGRFLGLANVISLWAIGLSAMLVHHFFYTYLNQKSINSSAAELSPFLQDQNNVNLIGTVIAHGSRAALTMSLGISFFQIFWETLRSRSYKLGQIDALVRCGQSPFNASIFRAASASITLLIISLIASSMALIVVFTPGSLTISSEFQRMRTCIVHVPTVPEPAILEPEFDDIGDRLDDSTMAMYASSSYFPPLRADGTTACGNGASTCSYNVTFVGASFLCVDVTNTTDMSPLLQPENPPSDAPYLIWNFGQPASNQSIFTFLSQDLVKGVAQATNCTLYNATYEVGIESDDSASSVRVWRVSHDSALADTSFMSFYSHAALDRLEGAVFAGPNGAFNVSNRNIRVQDNLFFVITPDGNHTWAGSVSDFLTSYIQNISISLLSGNIYYGVNDDTTTNLESVSSTCSSTFTVYLYDPPRLLATYAGALAFAAAIALYGCRLIMRNGREGRPFLSHIVRISLNVALLRMRVSGGLDEDTLVRLGRDSSEAIGCLLPTPVPSNYHVVKRSMSDANGRFSKLQEIQAGYSHLPPQRPKLQRRNRLMSCEVKVAALILLALSCMIAHHAYNHYLNGKVPSLSMGHSLPSQWLRDQAVVSDVGLALAYFAQTSLAAVIVIASTQVLWWTLRTRALPLYQIDSLMAAQSNPFSTSFIPAFRASFRTVLLAVLTTSMTLVSILSSSSINVDPAYSQTEDCTVMAPQNTSAIQFTSSVPDYSAQINTALTLGTYLPPLNACNLGAGAVQCSYRLDFVGPGFECQDVTASSNATAFITAGSEPGRTWVNQFAAIPIAQTSDLTIQLSVQTYDVSRAVYQAVICTGVLRSYSTFISHNSTGTSSINVVESQLASVVHANISAPPFTFTEIFLSQIQTLLEGLSVSTVFDGSEEQDSARGFGTTFMDGSLGTLGNIQLDGNITWRDNMTLALEEFAQNATLSILSGRMIVVSNASTTTAGKLLENETRTCTYLFTAYKYTPYRLFLTYGIAILIAIMCATWGMYAARRNGVEVSMDFSSILRSVLNEEMYNRRRNFDEDTIITATDTADGDLVPLPS